MGLHVLDGSVKPVQIANGSWNVGVVAGRCAGEMKEFYDFFAGGGMAQAGLGKQWRCLYANDIDENKGRCYARNWGSGHLRIADIHDVTPTSLPGRADLAWASFPCQDLSLAGSGEGLRGKRSGTFWPFLRLMEALQAEDRPPGLIVLENVCGALTSHGGRDFASITDAVAGAGYFVGALVMDAVHFLPQSRKRLFVVGVQDHVHIPAYLMAGAQLTTPLWHPPSVIRAYQQLPTNCKEKWIWWKLPVPGQRQTVLADLIADDPSGVPWHTAAETARLLRMMTPRNLAKVEAAKSRGCRTVGTIYKRTRPDGYGGRKQRAEVRFDDVAGCLRTPGGGSSRQTIIVTEGDQVRTRLLSPREAARLMGLPDDYWLPDNYNSAYHVAGDGLAVPVVKHLAQHLLEPLVEAFAVEEEAAA